MCVCLLFYGIRRAKSLSLSKIETLQRELDIAVWLTKNRHMLLI